MLKRCEEEQETEGIINDRGEGFTEGTCEA